MPARRSQRSRPTVTAFLAAIPDPERRAECRALARLMRRATGRAPRMWGDSIVAFGTYRYQYGSGREGEWFIAGFSPRKAALTIYLMGGLKRSLLARLGRHTTGRACLYLRRLADADPKVLRQLIAAGSRHPMGA